MSLQKTLIRWKMELSLDKVVQIVLGVKYVKNRKIQRVFLSYEEDILTHCLKASLNHISMVYSC